MTDHINTLIARTNEALRLANISVYLGMAAIICFAVFGTLASMAHFKDSTAVYYAFHYLPYLLIAISVPMSLYHAFFLWRYRIMQGSILATVLLTAISLMLFALIHFAVYGATITFSMSVFLAVLAWFAMPYVFRVNLRKFLNFLIEKKENNS